MSDLKPIPGFEGYLADSEGHIYSTVSQRGTVEPKLLRTGSAGKGYRNISLRKDGRRVTKRVHHLILGAHGQRRPSPQHETRHLDGDPANNRIDNLAWGTSKENTADAIEQGTFPSMEEHWKSKATKKDVLDIRQRYDHGEFSPRIHRDYPHLHEYTILRIAKREMWRGLPEADGQSDFALKRKEQLELKAAKERTRRIRAISQSGTWAEAAEEVGLNPNTLRNWARKNCTVKPRSCRAHDLPGPRKGVTA